MFRNCVSVNFKLLALGLFLSCAVMFGCQSEPKLPINSKLGGEFNLPSTQEGVQGVQNFKGQVVLLNFGFTSCPDVCPMILARLSQLYKQLGDTADNVQVVFITVDPEHDTVELLTNYLRFFNTDFVGFSGSDEQINAVAKQYGAVFMSEAQSEISQRSIAHSDFVYLLDQQGRVRQLYSTEDSLQVMGDDVRYLLAEKDNFFDKLLALF